jgi:penicillin-binding protein 2
MSAKLRATKIVDVEDLQAMSSSAAWQFVSRSKAIIFPISLVFVILTIVTASVQINAGAESVLRSEQNTLTSKLITPPRGLFYDRTGKKLTVNEHSYKLIINPIDFDQADLVELFGVISRETGVTQPELEQKLTGKTNEDVILLTGLTSPQAIILGNSLSHLPINLIADVKRNYLFPEEFAHVIGYTGLADIQDLEAGLLANDEVGKYRLEKIFDTQLRGVKGKELHTTDGNTTVSSLPGNNVFLTINSQWQEWLYKILGNQVDSLGGQSGAAVIVDVSNGDIWTYASYPSFDANQFASGITAGQYAALAEDLRKPLVDKVIGIQTTPGSTYKLVTSYALLQAGVVDENTHVYSDRCMYIGDYPFCEFGRFFIGDLDIVRALSRSSNIFFCDAILRLSQEQSYDRFVESAKALGLGELTGINIEGEVAGILATPELKLKLTGESWFAGDTCNSVIGQGMTTVTPLQMAMMVSTFFNGGKYYQPNLVSRIADQSGNIVEENFHKLIREVPLTDKTRDLIQAGMYNVVNTEEWTDYWFLHHIPLNFYVKTGSAETVDFSSGQREDKVDGWLVGKFDYQGKTFAFGANIRFAGGGWNISQVMMRFGNCLVNDFADGCDQI